MEKNDGILLIGAGGHAAVILDALRASGHSGPVMVFADKALTDTLLGEPVSIGLPLPDDFPPTRWRAHVAIGNNKVREVISRELTERGYGLATILHPTAVLSPYSEIGAGSALLACAVVNPRAKLGLGAIINTGAVVEHDCTLGDWCHVSPRAVMAGGSHAAATCWIGAGSVVRQGARLCAGITLGANAVVLDHLNEPGTYVGRPAVILQQDIKP